MAKKTTKTETTLPGAESVAVHQTLMTCFTFLNTAHLDFIKEDLNLKIQTTKGVLRSNFQKMLTYIDSVLALKTNIIPINTKTVVADTQDVAEPSSSGRVLNSRVRLPRKRLGFTVPTKPAVPTIAVFKAVAPPGKGAAPATKQSFMVAEEQVVKPVTITTAPTSRKAKTTTTVDVFEKLGNSELERYKKLPLSKAYPHVRIVKIDVDGVPTKVIVVGTAMGYKVSNYYNVNCAVNDVLSSQSDPSVLHKEKSGKICFYSSKQAVEGKKDLEERYIRLFKYQDGMSIRYWLHNKTRRCDEEQRFLEIAGDKVVEVTQTSRGR